MKYPTYSRRTPVSLAKVAKYLSFTFPPTQDELAALYAVEQEKCIGQTFSSYVDGNKVVVLVEWVGHKLPPDILAYKARPVRGAITRKPDVLTETAA